jgi:hypothetical protein
MAIDHGSKLLTVTEKPHSRRHVDLTEHPVRVSIICSNFTEDRIPPDRHARQPSSKERFS